MKYPKRPSKAYSALVSAIALTLLFTIFMVVSIVVAVNLDSAFSMLVMTSLLIVTGGLAVFTGLNLVDATRRLTHATHATNEMVANASKITDTVLRDEHHADLFRHALRALEREMLAKQTRLADGNVRLVDVLGLTEPIDETADMDALKREAMRQLERQLEHVELMHQEVNRLRAKDLDPYVVLVGSLSETGTTDTEEEPLKA